MKTKYKKILFIIFIHSIISVAITASIFVEFPLKKIFSFVSVLLIILSGFMSRILRKEYKNDYLANAVNASLFASMLILFFNLNMIYFENIFTSDFIFDNVINFVVYFTITFIMGVFAINKIKYKIFLIILFVSFLFSLSSLLVYKVEFRHQGTHPMDFILNSESSIDMLKFGDEYFNKYENYSNTTRIHFGWPLIYLYKQEFITEERNGNIYLIDNFRFIFDLTFYYALVLSISVLFVSIKNRKFDIFVLKP